MSAVGTTNLGHPSNSFTASLAIHDHELLRPIASGSYGEVWLARNAVGTLRAVKIVRRDRFERAEDFEREFKGLQNFEPISRAYEGLVDILQIGRNGADGWFYYVMELADGVNVGQASSLSGAKGNSNAETGATPVLRYSPRTLRADLKSRGALPADEVIVLGLKLTAALAHLHAQGLVHRDVKPSNILFIGGEPKLADAGLVAAIDDARSLVGTVGYIAPEGPGTPQADLYALGKVLYEAAFGKDRQDFPQLPPDLASRPDHVWLLELNEIIAKACATDPCERYANADAMLVELQSLQAGKSVKRQRAWQRTLNRAKKLALALTALAFVSAIVYSLALRAPRSSSFKRSPVEKANEEYHKAINELHGNLNAVEAIKHLDKAVELDPKFADAYAQLADAWFSIPGQNSKNNGTKAAEKAVSLDPQSGLARVFFGAAKNFALDFRGAEMETKLAVKLSPDSEEVLLASALIFATLGRTNDALENLKKSIDVGQDTPSKLRVIYSGFVYAWCREYDRAIATYNETPWLKDGVDGPFGPHEVQSRAYLAKGDYANSMRLGRQSALERGGDAKQVNAEFDALDKAYKQGGRELYWRKKLELETPKRDEDHWIGMAAIHARLNQPEEAFDCLRRARTQEHEYFGLGIYTDPSFDALRNDQKFKELENELWKKK